VVSLQSARPLNPEAESTRSKEKPMIISDTGRSAGPAGTSTTARTGGPTRRRQVDASSENGDNTPAESPRTATGAGKRGPGRRAPVTITVSTSGAEGAEWVLEAKIGARVAVRSTTVAASRVWDIVQTLGDEKLSAAVRSVLDEHRRAAQAKADALSAQLLAVQAELAGYPPAP
jgi:hypothetical protein